MDVLYSITQKELIDNLNKMESASAVKSVLVLMTDDGICTTEFMNPLLTSFGKPIIGGVFHEIIVNSKRTEKGALLIPLYFRLQTKLMKFDEGENSTYFDQLESQFSEKIPESGSLFIFADAFDTGKSSFVEGLFNFFGFKFSYVGAGCGSYAFKSFPCVIHNSGLFGNAGVIGLTVEDVSLGVSHGWLPISNQMKVTEAKESTVFTINWEPAYEVYKRIVEGHSGKIFTADNFLEIAKSYPIGLVKIDGEMVVRDPIKAENGILYFFDTIESGQHICVLHGNIESLLSGAKRAKDKCLETLDDTEKNEGFVFCIDCFSRVKFLEDKFATELIELSGKQIVHGALTFGEIANVGESFLEIYNKTVIVAKWKQTI